MKPRLNKLYKKLSHEKIDALLVTKNVNVSYLSGFHGTEAYALCSPAANFLITDSKYAQSSKDEVTDFKVKIRDGSISKILKELCRKSGIERLGFESKWLSYNEHRRLKDELKRLDLVATLDLVEAVREIKGASEIRFIKRAVKISDRTYKSLLDFIKPGISEEEVAIEIDHLLRLNGAEANSFPTIAISGRRSSLPHGRPTPKRIGPNDPVLLDFGARCRCYCSDLTRMVFLGRMSEKFRRIYEWVLNAQMKAIEKLKPGVRISDIDRAARQYLERKGVGKYFSHRLGHGVGMEIHEEPSISQANKARLKEGMVFTIEPAVYIPGWGGCRIEDMVLVTRGGVEILSNSPRQMINIG